MPIIHTERTTSDATSYLDSFNGGDAIDLSVGDQLSGSVGATHPASIDTSDVALINVISGVTYTFSMRGSSDASVFGIGVPGTTEVTAPAPGAFEITLTFTATTTGAINLSFTANAPVDYTTTLAGISYPAPSAGDDYIVGNMTSDRVNLLDGNDTYIALGGSDVVTGGLGNDFINGVCGNDRIYGNEGDDTLHGGNGRDRLYGGLDDDYLTGGNQQDSLFGASGNDTLVGDKGDDSLNGGSGKDDLNGGRQNDTMTGGDGADIFRFRNNDGQDVVTDFTIGEDFLDLSRLNVWDFGQLDIRTGGTGIQIQTGNGNYIELNGLSPGDLSASDLILADAPHPTVSDLSDDVRGTYTDDFFATADGDDSVQAGGGHDTVHGGNGEDTLIGGDGDDEMSGGANDDRIVGDNGSDTITGGGGNDLLRGGANEDEIDGGTGNDRIFGDDGNDTLTGAAGNDRLAGGDGADDISGGTGKDIIDGGDGDDSIDGGWGDDRLTGGAGNDVFVFNEDNTRHDTITDFTSGEDIIDISDFDYRKLSDLNMIQDGDDVLINLIANESIRVSDTELTDLNATDFSF